MKKTLAVVAFALALAPPLVAQTGVVYTNQACFCSAAHIVAYDAATGAVVQTYSGVAGNGRGVVVVGNVLYYTMVDDNNIYMLDKTTGAPLGFIPTSVSSMSTIGWDGSQFWTSSYTGNDEAYRINLAGVTTSTIHLSLVGTVGCNYGSLCTYPDGMEYFNGMLIANRWDGGYGGTNQYDIYDLAGNVLQADFIRAPNGTGIAYDGTNFLVSDVRGGGYGVYNGVSGAFMNFVHYADGNNSVEDLSVDYALRQDTGGDVVPEPSTIILMMTGLFAVAGAGLRRRQSV